MFSQHVHLLDDLDVADVSFLLLLRFLVFFLGVLLLLALYRLRDQLVAHENVSADAAPPAAPALALLGDPLGRRLGVSVLAGQVSERAADVDAGQILEAADRHWG